MNRRLLLTSTLAAALVPAFDVARGAAPSSRIGWLTAQNEPSLAPYIGALREGLAELGYEDGRNLAIELRFGDDAIGRVPELAADLLRAGVSLVLVQGSAVPVVAKLNLPIPVIFVTSTDPVSAGLADTLARPRGNMTGLTFMAAELNAKRLELLREVIPELRRAAIVGNPEHPGEQLERVVSQDAGRRLGLQVDYYATATTGELAHAFEAMARDPPEALSILADGFSLANRHAILGFATAQRIPAISGWAVFAQSGALCTYGPRLAASYRRLAAYVDRILKGANPADLPIERPSKFELVVNLKAARGLGLTIPPALLARADEVIE
jgi:putative ABC transport system substrate-binding protein